MARHRSVYSEAHDSEKHPGNRPKAKQARKTSPGILNLGLAPGQGVLPPNLSEERRRELRARQLVALQGDPYSHQQKSGPLPHLQPLPDPDLQADQEVGDPRGEYFNQASGPVNTIFPVVRGPQPTHTKTRVLPEYAVHPPLPDFARTGNTQIPTELIAAISAEDQPLLEFDNKLTQIHTGLRDLRQSAERLLQSVSQRDDDPGSDDSPTSRVNNIYKLIATIIEPWYNILEDEFTQMLSGSEEYQDLEDDA